MKIFVADTYDAISKQAADEVIRIMKLRAHPVMCAASGDSPAGLYNEIVQRVKTNQIDTSNWYFVGLDEWAGMNGQDQGSCRYHLNEQFFHPLKIPDERICFFDGRADDLEIECQRAENFIVSNGGMDVAILGLGMNGHIGMNEPGTPAAMRSHVADLAETTKLVGQKYFKEPHQLTRGITLGISTLMEARHIILIVNGQHKAEITKKIIEEESSEQLPASLLRKHPAYKIFLDAGAASEIIGEN
jgi:galactosamine-6-phosphate isomerase